MPDISQITLPDTNTYKLVDGTKSGVYTVIGTQNADTSAWTGDLHGVSALYDGLTINYYLPYQAVSGTNVTLELTFDDNTTTGAIGVYRNVSNVGYGMFLQGDTITLTYYSAGSISIGGTATNIDKWICDAYVDKNVLQTPVSANLNYPVILGVPNHLSLIGQVAKDALNLNYNPSTGNLNTTTVNGYTPTGVWVGTQADYNLLTPDNNVTYFITDGQVAPTPNAGVIGYDNTSSGLSANTVQAAIDETTESVASKGINPAAITLSNVGSTVSTNNSCAIKLSDKLIIVYFDYVCSSASTAWVNLFEITYDNSISNCWGTVVDSTNSFMAYTQAYYDSGKIKVRVQGCNTNVTRGSMLIVTT